MLNKKIRILTVIISLAFSFQAAADVERGDWGFVPIAAPFYTPDTSLGAGAFLLAYRDVVSGTGAGTDQFGIAGTYTLKNQKSIAVTGDLVITDYYRATGKLSYSNSSSDFWGLGPLTAENDLEKITSEEYLAEGAFFRKMNQNLFIGPQVRIRSTEMTEIEDDGIFDNEAITGYDGGIETGFGIIFIYDSTDSPFYPTRGILIEGSTLTSSTSAGSDYDYSSLKADFRYYYGITGKHVLAFQSVAELATEDVSYQSMSTIGGSRIMRGLPEGRFTDINSLAFQGEYRFPLTSFLAGVLFASMGTVGSDVPALVSIEDYHYAGGAGLRYLVDRKKHIAVRIDLGLSEEGLNVYFLFREAF